LRAVCLVRTIMFKPCGKAERGRGKGRTLESGSGARIISRGRSQSAYGWDTEAAGCPRVVTRIEERQSALSIYLPRKLRHRRLGIRPSMELNASNREYLQEGVRADGRDLFPRCFCSMARPRRVPYVHMWFSELLFTCRQEARWSRMQKLHLWRLSMRL
jgi:hypothetical protein